MRPSLDIRRTIALLAATLMALTVAACGRDDQPDLVNGKKLFVGEGTCGSCHKLARAGTAGTQGPDLDEAFATARRDGMEASTIEGVVHNQIGNVRKGSIMKEDLVTGQDARDVAAYVAMVAGVPGEDTGALAAAGQKKATGTAEAENGRLEIPADPTGALAFAFAEAKAPAGSIEFVMPNESPIPHDIAVRNGGEIGKGEVVSTGGTSTFTADLQPGTYEFFCSVPGHEAGGMKGQLTVE